MRKPGGMPCFRFELAAVESIVPWGAPEDPSLTWFALTLGEFWIELDSDELFRYTPEVLAAWGHANVHADYQIASCVRDLRSSAGPALAPLPVELERLAGDVAGLDELQTSTRRVAEAIDPDAEADLYYKAWRWLGERSPAMSYFVEPPRFHFVRVGDDIQIGYDNRACQIDGVPVWTAQLGAYRLPVETFVAAITGVSTALLDAMAARIDELAAGRATPQTAVDIASLRAQHVTWQNEFAWPLAPSEPDVAWTDTLAALATLGARR